MTERRRRPGVQASREVEGGEPQPRRRDRAEEQVQALEGLGQAPPPRDAEHPPVESQRRDLPRAARALLLGETLPRRGVLPPDRVKTVAVPLPAKPPRDPADQHDGYERDY